MTIGWTITALAILLSFALVPVYRFFALKCGIIDIPNKRSSHREPLARGAGIVFVFTFIVGLYCLRYFGLTSAHIFLALLGGGLFNAFIGFVDDLNHVPARMRVLIHCIAGIWVMYLFGTLPPLSLGFTVWDWGWIGSVIGLLGIVWLTNLYNFMDGLDGLASSEGIFIAIAGAILLAVVNPYNWTLIWPLLLLAACLLGFLLWNWAPAKVFMGDVGSSFLGFIFAAVLVISLTTHELSPWPWLILFGYFWIDATWTLVRRLFRGERVYIAHRTHAFQHATKLFGSHKAVVLTVTIINCVWLFPMSLFAVKFSHYELLITLVALLPVWALCVLFKAGVNMKLPIYLNQGEKV